MSKCTGCPHAGKYAFCNLGESARNFLDTNSITMEYPRGNVLFREGEAAGEIFLVCSGKVKSTATSIEGRSAILRLSGPGDVLGMSAVLGRHRTRSQRKPCSPAASACCMRACCSNSCGSSVTQAWALPARSHRTTVPPSRRCA